MSRESNGFALNIAQRTVDTKILYSILLLLVLCQGEAVAEEATWLSSKALPILISGTKFYLRFNTTF